MALPFQPQCLHSHHTFLSHHIVRTKAFLPTSNNNNNHHHLVPVVASKGSVLVHKRFLSRSVFSRKKKKKKNTSGSRRFARLVLNLIPIIASNLKAPPRQLQLIAEELGGGDGSGGGPGWFWGGGSGWGWFDGWRRGGGRRKFGFWAILVACGLSLLLVGETESLAVCRVLGLGLFGLGVIGGWSEKKGTAVVRNGVLGICFLGAVSLLGLRKEEILQLKSWFQELALGRQIGRRRRRRPGKFW